MLGLIAFFDILGYQSFLENNSATETAIEVLSIINNLPKENSSFVKKHLQAMNIEGLEIQLDSLNHVVFSDTIVLTISYPPNATQACKSDSLGFLSLVSSRLCATMFLEGLPVRGVIVEGNFIQQGTCLAGKGIVEAYRICESLELSGLILSKELSDRFEGVPSKKTKVLGGKTIDYLTPFKNLKEERRLHLNWIQLLGKAKQTVLSDIDTAVLRSFSARNKDCPLAVDQKIRNTSKLMRRLAIALEDGVTKTPSTSSAPPS